MINLKKKSKKAKDKKSWMTDFILFEVLGELLEVIIESIFD